MSLKQVSLYWNRELDTLVNKLSLISNAKFSHAHSRKYRVRQGKEGKFLIATYGNGLYVYNSVDGQLEHFQADDEKPLIAFNYIERFFVDRQGPVWLNEAFLGLSYISYPRHPEVEFAFAGNAYHGDWSNCVSMLMPMKNGEAMVSISYRQHAAVPFFQFRLFSAAPQSLSMLYGRNR